MHVDEALLQEAVRKTTRREKYGQYLKIPIERWNWFSFSNQLKILHCTWMESPDSYTIVSILLWNRSRRRNLTQFDEAAVAEFLWLTSFLLKLTDFNFLAGKICVEHWVLFYTRVVVPPRRFFSPWSCVPLICIIRVDAWNVKFERVLVQEF